MPIRHSELSVVQRAAVAQAIIMALWRAAPTSMHGGSDTDRERRSPIIAGTIRCDGSGLCWLSWGLGRWYRMREMDRSDLGQITIVTNDDGAPLGQADGGPLMIAASPSGSPVALVVNTGWKHEAEIDWIEAERMNGAGSA
jgi:hypothetical protein